MYVPKKGAARPNIFDLLQQMNRKWMLGRQFRSLKHKRTSTDDAYRFFFDDPSAVAKIATIMAKLCCMMTASMKLDSTPYELRYLIPLRNIVLHKLGFEYKDQSMDHWAFRLGQLMQEANRIYRKFFVRRRSTVPVMLIGQKFAEAAYQNPRDAFATFLRDFAPCLHWAQESNIYLLEYRKLLKQIVEETKGDLPTRFLPQEAILFNAGYLHYVPKPEEKKDESAANP